MEHQYDSLTSIRQGAQDQTDEREIDLLELGYELLGKIRYIILTALIGCVLAGIYSFLIAKPVYEAVAKLYVLNSQDSVVNLSDLQLGNYLASDYTEVFKTWEVHEMVRTNLGIDYTVTELEEMVKVTNPKDTRILYITVQSSDPALAMSIANEYSTVVSDYVSRIMATERPNVLSKAKLPTITVSPQKTRNIIIGLLLGVLLSAGIIIVRFIMDDSIKSPDDVTKYAGLTVLACVPLQGTSDKQSKKKH